MAGMGVGDEAASGDPEARHDRIATAVGSMLSVALDDRGLAEAATDRAVADLHRADPRAALDEPAAIRAAYARAWVSTTATRRWRSPPEPVGPPVIASGTSGPHARLDAALRSLPPRQRSALLGTLVQGWDHAASAEAHACASSTIELRQNRAWAELSRHDLHDGADASAPADDTTAAEAALHERVGDRLAAFVTSGELKLHGREASLRRARRTTVRTRLLALAAGVLVIALAGSVVRALGDPPVVDEEIVEPARPPRGSQAPFAPIGDGRGGFVALDQRAWELSTSTDGVEWFTTSHLNVNKLDLRLFVERIYRSDGRFVALVESSTGGGRSINGSDAQRVAISETTDRWRLLRFEPPDLPTVDGLRSTVDLLNAALADDRVLLAVEIETEVDLAARRIAVRDVCAVANDGDGLVVHRCDGEQVVVASARERTEAGLDDGRRLYESVDGGPFVEVPTGSSFNPYGLLAFDGGFLMLNESSSELSVSPDGSSWSPMFETGIDNRLGLLASHGDMAVAIAPRSDGWTSHLIVDGQVRTGQVPVPIDPTSVWLKPEFAHGPAGWALFVTTSRPWERSDRSGFGWALQADEWIVDRKADQATLVLRSTTDTSVYEYRNLVDSSGDPLPHPDIDRGLFGDVRVRRPGSTEVLVTVDSEQIRDSWVTGEAAGDPPFGVVEWDGYEVRGNLRTGPIELHSPSGRVGSWADGFAFTNGDTSDGVETDRFRDSDDATVDFHGPDGTRLLSIPFSALEPLDLPPVVDDVDGIRALVVWSPDGVNWQTVWESSRSTWYGSVAVGDDEVLLSVAGIAADPERIVVPPAD